MSLNQSRNSIKNNSIMHLHLKITIINLLGMGMDNLVIINLLMVKHNLITKLLLILLKTQTHTSLVRAAPMLLMHQILTKRMSPHSDKQKL